MNVVLIGFMGAGKSSVGKRLAEKLGMGFADMDEEIEKKAGKSVQEIFSEKGEKYFRDIEENIVSGLSCSDGFVIATGGGVVLRDKNVQRLKKSSVIIWLKVSPEEAFTRTGGQRPLLKGSLENARKLHGEREGLYKKAADVVIDVKGLKTEEVVERIEAELGGLL